MPFPWIRFSCLTQVNVGLLKTRKQNVGDDEIKIKLEAASYYKQVSTKSRKFTT